MARPKLDNARVRAAVDALTACSMDEWTAAVIESARRLPRADDIEPAPQLSPAEEHLLRRVVLGDGTVGARILTRGPSTTVARALERKGLVIVTKISRSTLRLDLTERARRSLIGHGPS